MKGHHHRCTSCCCYVVLLPLVSWSAIGVDAMGGIKFINTTFDNFYSICVMVRGWYQDDLGWYGFIHLWITYINYEGASGNSQFQDRHHEEVLSPSPASPGFCHYYRGIRYRVRPTRESIAGPLQKVVNVFLKRVDFALSIWAVVSTFDNSIAPTYP